LNDLALRFVPEIKRRCDREYLEAKERAAKQWPVVDGWVSNELFITEKLAKARRDVELTYAVFKASRPDIHSSIRR
jgi:hypothetical protein